MAGAVDAATDAAAALVEDEAARDDAGAAAAADAAVGAAAAAHVGVAAKRHAAVTAEGADLVIVGTGAKKLRSSTQLQEPTS